MRNSRALRVLAAVAVTVSLLVASRSSDAADWYPGLPPNDGSTTDQWINSGAGGIGYSKLAKQWFRNPAGMVTTRQGTTNYPTVDGVQKFKIHTQSYFPSPPGAPAPYGYMAPVTVRGLGFGLMPVEATLQVSQRRKNGLPIPLEVDLHSTYVAGLHNGEIVRLYERQEPVSVEEAMNVEILRIKVDGVDVGLTGRCRTVTPAALHLVGPGYEIPLPTRYPGYKAEWYATQDPKTYWQPMYGGYMSGTIDIPAFTGCTTKSGDDLSALMTKSASGKGNPIEAVSAWACNSDKVFRNGVLWPAAPGMNTPKKTDCEGVRALPYPEPGE